MSQWWNDEGGDDPTAPSNPPPAPPPGSPDMPTTGAWSSPGTAPAAGGGGRSGGGVPWPVVIAAVIALVGGLLAYNSLAGDDDTLALEGEIFLERADEAGADPFIDEYDTLVSFDPADVTPPNAGAAASVSRAASGGSSGGGSPPLSNAEILALTFNGAEPGLYGGTGNSATCNKAALIAFLEENLEKAAAWAGAQGIDPSDIRTFVDGLTTVVLLADTRVTNHGFKNGAANPIQSVLQAGTAVMIDAEGIPRVKCGCGNPLRKPVPQTRTVVVQGEPWPDFDPAAIATVEPAEEPVDTFTLADPATGTTVERPVGTDGEADVTLDTPAPQPLEDLAEAAAAAAEAAEAESESAADEPETDVAAPDDDVTGEDSDAVVAPAPDDSSADDPPPEATPTADDDPPPIVFDGATYCERYQNYIDQVGAVIAIEDEAASERRFAEILFAAIGDLPDFSPPELEADWQLYVDWARGTSVDAFISGNSPDIFTDALNAASDRITDHGRNVCGIENL